MKVVHIYSSLTFGGIETMLVNIANAQAELGADVSIVIISDACEVSLVKAISPKCHYYNLGRKAKSKSLGFILKLNALLNKLQPDAIHLHGGIFYSLLLHKHYREIACVTLHTMPTGTIPKCAVFKWLLRKFPILNYFCYRSNISCLTLVPNVCSISKSVHDDLRNIYGIESKVIVNGIKTSDFSPKDSERCGQPFKIVQVGRLLLLKGQDVLISALEKDMTDIHVDFIGEGKDYKIFMHLVDEKGIAQSVSFLGKKNQSYIASHLRNYDLFVMPSRFEGFGLTVAEAMAAEIPVLVSNIDGPIEITEGNKYGWTFESENADDLRMKIKYIKEHYSEALSKVKLAKKHVVDNYDVSATAKKYLEIYSNL